MRFLIGRARNELLFNACVYLERCRRAADFRASRFEALLIELEVGLAIAAVFVSSRSSSAARGERERSAS